jgi:hypothetical protein
MLYCVYVGGAQRKRKSGRARVVELSPETVVESGYK